MLDRKIRYCSLPEAVRDHFLWGARSIVIAGTHGKTTTTSLTGWLLAHGGADPSVFIGGIAENFESSYRHRRRPRVRHRRGRVRQRLLRQDREVPEVPAGHRRRQQHRVRPRRHLSGPRGDPAGVSALRQPGSAARAAAARRRQRRGAGARASARTAGSRRSACRDGADWQAHDLRVGGNVDDLQRAARRRRRSAASNCRCSAPTTSATRSRRSPSARRSGLNTDTMREALRRFKGVRRRMELRGTAAGVRSTTTSRTIRPRSPRRSRASAPHFPDRRVWAIFEPRSATSCRRIFQADFARALAKADTRGPARGVPLDAAGRRSACRPSSWSPICKAAGVDARYIPQVDDIVEHRGAREPRAATSWSSCRTAASTTSTASCWRPSRRARPAVNSLLDGSRPGCCRGRRRARAWSFRSGSIPTINHACVVARGTAARRVGRRSCAMWWSATARSRSISIRATSMPAGSRREMQAPRRATPNAATRPAARTIEVPVCYGGDVRAGPRQTSRRSAAARSRTSSSCMRGDYRVYMVGFVPGFAYMAEVDPRIAAPRRTTPRTAVPAGSVAIAGGQTGIYPKRRPAAGTSSAARR